MKEATEQKVPVVAETPKTNGKVKEGTKVATTSVDGATAEPKAPRVPKQTNIRYSIRAGVDAAKFRGQRQIVVKALQGLQGEGDGKFSLEQIAAKCEGLVSKTPVEASAKYHLDGLAKSGEVVVFTEAPPAPAPVAEAPAETAQPAA